MEFPELGKNCQNPNCNALEFLPVVCDYCNKIFCSDHFHVISHNCENVSTIDITSATEKKCDELILCCYPDCIKLDPVRMSCIKCKNHFCLKHRYHSCFDYGEAEIVAARNKQALLRDEFSKTLAKVESKTQERIEKCKKSSKTRATALKVQLMKLKGKAVGDKSVPTSERVYFQVYMPLRLKLNSKAVFVSSKWTVGKAVDNISLQCDIPNKNNVSNCEKLRLFLKNDGDQLCSDMSQVLSELIDLNTICNGDSLILEYVSHDSLNTNLTSQLVNYNN